MSENQTISDIISSQYSASESLRVKVLQNNEGKEEFQATASEGVITLKGSGPLCATYGASVLNIASKSGHVGEFLGRFSPHYSLRPLWLGGGQTVQVSDATSLSIPTCFTEDFLEDSEDFCQRVIEWGFNAIILGDRPNSGNSLEPCSMDFSKLCQALERFGLQVILKPKLDLEDCCPVDDSYAGQVERELGRCLAAFPTATILWESRWADPHFMDAAAAERYTQYELVVKEEKMVEKALASGSSLIFYVASPTVATAKTQAEWLEKLCDEVGAKTTLAFSAVAGNPSEDWRGLHPVWKKLRESIDVSSTRLLPFVNVGCLGLGEGLWPLLSIDLIDQVISRMQRHQFAGFVSVVNHLPTSKGLLACNLFAAGQALWGRRSAPLAAETFFKANHPEFASERFFDVASQARRLVFKLYQLRARGSDRDRLTIEELLASIKAMEAGVFDSALQLLVHHFAKDIKRMIVLTAKALGIPCPNALGNEDHRGGFWTRATQGAATPATVTILDAPLRDETDSVQAALFDLNRRY